MTSLCRPKGAAAQKVCSSNATCTPHGECCPGHMAFFFSFAGQGTIRQARGRWTVDDRLTVTVTGDGRRSAAAGRPGGEKRERGRVVSCVLHVRASSRWGESHVVVGHCCHHLRSVTPHGIYDMDGWCVSGWHRGRWSSGYI